VISLACADQPAQQGAQTTQALLGILGAQRHQLNLVLTRRATPRTAIHQAQQAEAPESM
jgi:hypothetical protein